MFALTKKQKNYLKIKRFLDIFLSFALIVIFFPLFILVICLVKLSSPGPVFFGQIRPGLHKKPFKIYKFRTMKVQTISENKLLTDKERLTKIGFLLRKTSIDELPQIINVIKGEMSFIGPRPLLFNDLKSLETNEQIRFLLRPGISSYAGVNGRNALLRKEKYIMEINYVKKISFLFDVKIFFQTIKVVLRGTNIEDKVNTERIAADIIETDKDL